jgi:CRP/FNR family transcriptional regulator, dissimilatory nitrate respiration regulator
MIDPRLLTEQPIFSKLPSGIVGALARQALECRFAPGQVLFSAGTTPRGLLVIVEGKVRVLRGQGDRQHVIHEEGPGGALGEVPVFGGGTYPASAIAAEPTRCLLLLTESVRAAVQNDAETALTFLRRLGERTRHLVERLDSLASRGVNARLARFLLTREASAQPSGSFTLGGTQVQVAEELGTVREVLVRALRELRQAGAIESTGRGRYRIRNVGVLQRLIHHRLGRW